VWLSEHVLQLDGVQFVAHGATNRFTSTPDRFCVVKRPDLVGSYLDLLAELRPSTIVEPGVYQGGSCALMALAADPDVLVSVEFSEERVPALDTLIATRGLGDRVHVHHGVDQADGPTLGRIVDDHLEGRPLDLVVDDASHLMGPTRASFNALFPRLRPGGIYVIEDWSWAHVGYGTHRPTETPLTVLVFEHHGAPVAARLDHRAVHRPRLGDRGAGRGGTGSRRLRCRRVLLGPGTSPARRPCVASGGRGGTRRPTRCPVGAGDTCPSPAVPPAPAPRDGSAAV
jgi:predicted O-methyltransferase YrrM